MNKPPEKQQRSFTLFQDLLRTRLAKRKLLAEMVGITDILFYFWKKICSSLARILLISSASKILLHIIPTNNRICSYLPNPVGVNRFHVGQGLSMTDAKCQFHASCHEQEHKLCFVNNSEAFNLINWDCLFRETCKDMGVPKDFIALLRNLYS